MAAHAVARGQVVAPVLSTWSVEGPCVSSRTFPIPLERMPCCVLNALLRDAAARLVTEGQAVVRLSVRFALEGGGAQTLAVRVGSPTRSPRRLLDLLRLRLERFSLAAPVERVVLEISQSTPFDGQQGDLLQQGRASEALADVTARLQDALGPQAVVVPTLRSRHRPEAEWAPRSVQAERLDRAVPRQVTLALPREGPLSAALKLAPEDDPVAEWEGFVEALPPRRPAVLLPQRQAVVVRTQGGVPVRVQVDGRWLEVQEAEGPERLAGEWWAHPMLREYWRAKLEDGRTAWLCREDGLWLLHGWWD